MNRGTNIETLIGYTFDSLRREIAQRRRSAFSVDELVAEIEVQAPVLKMEAPNTLRPAQQRVKALDRLPYIGRRFDWAGTLQPGAFVNIDCRGLLLGDLRIITAAVARDLQNLAREKKIPFTVLSIDEFHLVAPNDDKLVSTQVLRGDRPDRAALPARAGPDHPEPGGRGPGSAQAHAHPLRAHHRAGPARLAARDLRRRAAGDDPAPCRSCPAVPASSPAWPRRSGTRRWSTSAPASPTTAARPRTYSGICASGAGPARSRCPRSSRRKTGTGRPAMPAEHRKLDVVEREQAHLQVPAGHRPGGRSHGPRTARAADRHGGGRAAAAARCATRSRCRRTTNWSPGWCWTAGSSRSATPALMPSGTRSRPPCTPIPR